MNERTLTIGGTLSAICLLALLAGPAGAVPMTFNISQTGFTGGGSITGSFTGDDLNSDGEVVSFAGEVSAFSAVYSGGGGIGPTAWGLADLFGLVYELGTGDIGDDAPLAIEGILADNNVVISWNTGNGPGGLGFAPGGVILDLQSGVQVSTQNLVVVTQAPEPTALALLGLGLAGLGWGRKRQA